MEELVLHSEIGGRIITLRGEQVMLDRDLAELYGVKPIRLREQMKRNKERFPLDFMFQLTEAEVEIMVSQNAIPSRRHLGGALPYAFTEQGIYMLASVFKSPKAIEVNISIIRTYNPEYAVDSIPSAPIIDGIGNVSECSTHLPGAPVLQPHTSAHRASIHL